MKRITILVSSTLVNNHNLVHQQSATDSESTNADIIEISKETIHQ
jgi:hypothetical protein